MNHAMHALLAASAIMLAVAGWTGIVLLIDGFQQRGRRRQRRRNI